MNANDMTYGVEIECYVPQELVTSGRINAGPRHAGRQVSELPVGWNAQHDGSLGYRRGRQGVEIVSPVLRGAEGLRQIVAVCAWLSRNGASVSVSCGFHVHVGFDPADRAGLERLLAVVANYEDALFASTGTQRRERSSWCKSVRRNAALQAGQLVNDRYHVLNVTNIVNGTKPTVEFRAFGGTINAGKIIAHVRQCLGLVEKALETSQKAAWTPKPTKEGSPLGRKGKGLGALTRLLYRLGWTRGQSKKVYGEVVGEGLPTMERSKAELRRLARKYDAGRG
jgi:hypothetical protein